MRTLIICMALLMTSDVVLATPLEEAPVIPKAKTLAEPGRYESPRNFADTVKYYERALKRQGGARWYPIINSPKVKAKHAASRSKKTAWQGINIYEVDGHVRIFVIPRHTDLP